MHKQKTIRVGRVELIDKQGRTRAVFGAENGVPYMARYDGKGRILSWLTFLVDGTPDVKFFSDNGAGNEKTFTAVKKQVANGKESLT
jgi:hypothetical protein